MSVTGATQAEFTATSDKTFAQTFRQPAQLISRAHQLDFSISDLSSHQQPFSNSYFHPVSLMSRSTTPGLRKTLERISLLLWVKMTAQNLSAAGFGSDSRGNKGRRQRPQPTWTAESHGWATISYFSRTLLSEQGVSSQTDGAHSSFALFRESSDHCEPFRTLLTHPVSSSHNRLSHDFNQTLNKTRWRNTKPRRARHTTNANEFILLWGNPIQQCTELCKHKDKNQTALL